MFVLIVDREKQDNSMSLTLRNSSSTLSSAPMEEEDKVLNVKEENEILNNKDKLLLKAEEFSSSLTRRAKTS